MHDRPPAGETPVSQPNDHPVSSETPVPQPPERGAVADSWSEVGEQLQELATRLATAFRTAWNEEQEREQEEAAKNLSEDLRSAADRFDRTVRRMADETEEERAEALRITRQAGEKSLSEVRAAAVSALRTLNRQLDTLAARLERQQGTTVDAPPKELEPPHEEATTEE